MDLYFELETKPFFWKVHRSADLVTCITHIYTYAIERHKFYLCAATLGGDNTNLCTGVLNTNIPEKECFAAFINKLPEEWKGGLPRKLLPNGMQIK